MQMKCLKCGSVESVRNGRVFGQQRYKCKVCGFQFTKMAPAGKPLFIKLMSHGLYVSGLSMREIAQIVGVTAQSVSRWIKKWHPAYMMELGNRQNVRTVMRETLLEQLNIAPTDTLMVSSTTMPSGATFHIVVQLPPSEKEEK